MRQALGVQGWDTHTWGEAAWHTCSTWDGQRRAAELQLQVPAGPGWTLPPPQPSPTASRRQGQLPASGTFFLPLSTQETSPLCLGMAPGVHSFCSSLF